MIVDSERKSVFFFLRVISFLVVVAMEKAMEKINGAKNIEDVEGNS